MTPAQPGGALLASVQGSAPSPHLPGSFVTALTAPVWWVGAGLSAGDTGNGLFRETRLEGEQLAIVCEICTVLERDSALAAWVKKPVSTGHAVPICLLS